MSIEELAEAFVEVSRSAAYHDPIPDTLRIMLAHANENYQVSRESMNIIGTLVVAIGVAEKRAENNEAFSDIIEEEYSYEEWTDLSQAAGEGENDD